MKRVSEKNGREKKNMKNVNLPQFKCECEKDFTKEQIVSQEEKNNNRWIALYKCECGRTAKRILDLNTKEVHTYTYNLKEELVNHNTNGVEE